MNRYMIVNDKDRAPWFTAITLDEHIKQAQYLLDSAFPEVLPDFSVIFYNGEGEFVSSLPFLMVVELFDLHKRTFEERMDDKNDSTGLHQYRNGP